MAKDGRVYVLSEPTDCVPILVCLDDATGTELWRREIDQFDAETRAAFSAFAATRRASQRTGKQQGGWVPGPLASRDIHVPIWGIFGNVFTTGDYDGAQWTGFTFGAPLTDGNRVWIWTFPNVAACFDRDGNRLWLRQDAPEHGEQTADYCFCTCPPAIFDGVLIVASGKLVRGIDCETGEVRWRHELLRKMSWQATQPKLVTVGGVHGAFCIDGGVYRPADGKLLVDVGEDPVESGTVAHEDTVFLTCMGKSRGRLGIRSGYACRRGPAMNGSRRNCGTCPARSRPAMTT